MDGIDGRRANIILGQGKNDGNGEKRILEVITYLKPESTGLADRFLWAMREREELWMAIWLLAWAPGKIKLPSMRWKKHGKEESRIRF